MWRRHPARGGRATGARLATWAGTVVGAAAFASVMGAEAAGAGPEANAVWDPVPGCRSEMAAAGDAAGAVVPNVDKARALAAVGDADYAARDYAAAVADYSAAITCDPGFGLAYAGRGGARTYEGDPEGALADFNAALAKGFATAWAYNGRGNAYRVLRETKRALADYVRAVELDPHEVDAFLNLGDLHSLAGRYALAVAAYGLALDFRPEDPVDAVAAHARRGGVLAKLGRPEEALADFEQSFVIGGAWQIAGVQRELAAAGLYAGAITGTYDRATAQALRRCLADRGC